MFIPLPSYLLSDAELLELAERLVPFAEGNADYTDEPCTRAQTCLREIGQELIKRGGTYGIDNNTGKFTLELPKIN
jgi:hypothetical protein